jgi:hypothetical protein
VEQDGQGVFLRRHWAAALSAAPGEAAVVRCSAATGIEEVFIAIPGNKALSVLDGASGLLIASIDLGKCTPYQVYHRDDDPRRRVFVGCFKEDKVLAIDADCTADIRYTVGEVTQ